MTIGAGGHGRAMLALVASGASILAVAGLAEFVAPLQRLAGRADALIYLTDHMDAGAPICVCGSGGVHAGGAGAGGARTGGAGAGGSRAIDGGSAAGGTGGKRDAK